MKKQLFILVSLLILSFSTFSQVYFNNEYGNDSSSTTLGSSIYALKDSSGYIVNGTISTNETTYIRILYLDINGDTIWSIMHGKYNISENSGLGKMISIGDTNFVFSGITLTDSITHSPDSAVISLYKIDINGNLLWNKQFGDSNKKSYGNDIQLTLDGGFIITGWTTGWGNLLSYSSFLLKLDSLGNEEWHQIYGGPFGSKRDAFSVDLAENKGYIFSGRYYQSLTTREDINIIKTDSLGNVLWNKIYGTNERDAWGYITKYGDSGDYILTAGVDITPGVILSDFQGYIARIDGANGNIVWDDTLGIINNGTDDAFQSNVIVSGNGSILAVGVTTFSSSGGGTDSWLVKYDGNGNKLWQRNFNKYGGTNQHYFWDVQATLDGGFVMCGDLSNFSVPEQNIWVVKVDSLGCEIPNCTVGYNDVLNPTSNFIVYPNPTSGMINIEQVKQTSSTFNLVDITGKKLISKKLNSKTTKLNLDIFPKGIYFYQITNQEIKVKTGKLIIQ